MSLELTLTEVLPTIVDDVDITEFQSRAKDFIRSYNSLVDRQLQAGLTDEDIVTRVRALYVVGQSLMGMVTKLKNKLKQDDSPVEITVPMTKVTLGTDTYEILAVWHTTAAGFTAGGTTWINQSMGVGDGSVGSHYVALYAAVGLTTPPLSEGYGIMVRKIDTNGIVSIVDFAGPSDAGWNYSALVTDTSEYSGWIYLCTVLALWGSKAQPVTMDVDISSQFPGLFADLVLVESMVNSLATAMA
jgi:hypothetical protein